MTRTASHDRALIQADRDAREFPEHASVYTLDRHIREARARMGEAKWRKLNTEWIGGES